jgi:hypothetical protein
LLSRIIEDALIDFYLDFLRLQTIPKVKQITAGNTENIRESIAHLAIMDEGG